MYILVIWAMVGYAVTQHSTWERYDWRLVGEFSSLHACWDAAMLLDMYPKTSPTDLPTKSFRCLKK